MAGIDCGRPVAALSADGKELYFVVDGKMMASTIRASGSSFEAGTPNVLFPVHLDWAPADTRSMPCPETAGSW